MVSLKEKWNKGQIRKYDLVVNRGCCYCVSKVWKGCGFPHRVRIGNDCVKEVAVDLDISDFRLSDDNPECYYIFVVIIDTPKYWDGGFSRWERAIDWLLRRWSPYVYFHKGQIVICDTDKDLGSPRETPWGS